MVTDAGRSPIVPTLRYRDADAAVEWLCDAFGFDEHMVVRGDDGEILHAQLTRGGAMIMLGGDRDDAFGAHQKPANPAKPVTQSPYLVIPEIEEHYGRAVASGADIVMELEEQDHGGKAYACRDPEGHLWNFGSYDPWGPPPEAG